MLDLWGNCFEESCFHKFSNAKNCWKHIKWPYNMFKPSTWRWAMAFFSYINYYFLNCQDFSSLNKQKKKNHEPRHWEIILTAATCEFPSSISGFLWTSFIKKQNKTKEKKQKKKKSQGTSVSLVQSWRTTHTLTLRTNWSCILLCIRIMTMKPAFLPLTWIQAAALTCVSALQSFSARCCFLLFSPFILNLDPNCNHVTKGCLKALQNVPIKWAGCHVFGNNFACWSSNNFSNSCSEQHNPLLLYRKWMETKLSIILYISIYIIIVRPYWS